MTQEPVVEPRATETRLLWGGLIVSILLLLAALYAIYDQRQNTANLGDQIRDLGGQVGSLQQRNQEVQKLLDQQLQISPETFLKRYNELIAQLKAASDAYEKARAAEGANIPGSDAAGTFEGARNKLNESADQFTTFIDRWRLVVEPLSKLLDGNVTRLEDSRRENNSDDVNETSRRIINSAPDLATPLRIQLDKMKNLSGG
jgi:hypothetical protein